MAKESATKGKNQTKEEKISRRSNKRGERLAWREKRREARLRYLEKKAGRPHSKEFFLVFWMLVSLTIVVIGIIVLPLFLKLLYTTGPDKSPLGLINAVNFSEIFKETLDYSKWVLSALLAAFGAWIGAGAAYFFGKENLRESSRATEEALRIQQQSLGTKPEAKTLVKDLTLTAMNPSFIFKAEDELQTVITSLESKLGYWFVPIVEKDTGILKDVISSQAFWEYHYHLKEMEKEEGQTAENNEGVSNKQEKQSPKTQEGKNNESEQEKESDKGPLVSDLIKYLDENEEYKKLHGVDVFFIKIKLNDTLQDVADRMKSPNTAVAIVVDAKGKPTHCLTRTDLGTLLKPES